MDTRETTKLVEILKNTLEDVSLEDKIQYEIEKYLYIKKDKAILMPEILWSIIVYLGEEVEKGNQLLYQEDTVDCNIECLRHCKKESCWSEEELVFVKTGNTHNNITGEPRKKIECGGSKMGLPELRICALFLRGCLYKYNPEYCCYVSKEFYRWSMFVFFLYSFDAFSICFQYCIKSGNKSLNVVFCDILELILWLQDLIDDKSNDKFRNKFRKGLGKNDKELEEAICFIKWIFRDCVSIGNIRYEVLNSRMTAFLDSMTTKTQKRKLALLIKNNEQKTDEILGEKLRIKILRELDKNWLEDSEEA